MNLLTEPINDKVTWKIKVVGLRVKVKIPVLLTGYVVGL